MARNVYIVLGSNFDPCIETGMKFVEELHQQGDEVAVYSIDMIAKPEEQPVQRDGLSVTRISRKISREGLDQLVDEIVQSNPQIDSVIVMDGIDYKDIVFGDDLQSKIQERCPGIPKIPVIHFIGAKYVNAWSNMGKIEDCEKLKEFNLTTVLDNLIPKDEYGNIPPKEKMKLMKLQSQLIQGTPDNIYTKLQSFLRSTQGIKSLVGEENKQEAKLAILTELNRLYCGSMGLEQVQALTEKSSLRQGMDEGA